MELTWSTIFFLMIAIAVGWFWLDSLRAREAANTAAMDACSKLGLQFLDGTVAFSRLRWVRDAGQLRLRRTYIFDYTAQSIDRLQGFVVLLGTTVESVGFARDSEMRGNPVGRSAPSSTSLSVTIFPTNHDVQSPDPKPAETDSAPIDNSDGKVLDLDHWRRSRAQRH